MNEEQHLCTTMGTIYNDVIKIESKIYKKFGKNVSKIRVLKMIIKLYNRRFRDLKNQRETDFTTLFYDIRKYSSQHYILCTLNKLFQIQSHIHTHFDRSELDNSEDSVRQALKKILAPEAHAIRKEILDLFCSCNCCDELTLNELNNDFKLFLF
jgi:hypothetical protein